MVYNCTMEDIKEIISRNIASIRKKRKLTQVELSEKLNYSDKAISRWENGESLPDIETLYKLSEALEVPIAMFFEENAFEENVFKENECRKTNNIPNKIVVTALSCIVVWLVATIIYFYVYMYSDIRFWKVFIWAIPVTMLVLMYCNKNWGWPKIAIFLRSAVLWSLAVGIYCQFLEYNIWIVFLLFALLQAIVIVGYFIKPIKPETRFFGWFNQKK